MACSKFVVLNLRVVEGGVIETVRLARLSGFSEIVLERTDRFNTGLILNRFEELIRRGHVIPVTEFDLAGIIGR